MSYLYQWTKSIVFFYILMTAALHLLPQSSYQRYLRFFGGMVIAALLIAPLLQALGREGDFFEAVSTEGLWQGMDADAPDFQGMEQWRQGAFRQQYEKAIAQDVAGMAPEGYAVEGAAVRLSEDLRVEAVELCLRASQEPEGPHLSEGEDGDEALLRLRERLKEYYQLSEEQISIAIQEGVP